MARLLFVHALSPVHIGTGQALGAVDLPLAREKTTGFPYVPGSSLKGVLRDVARGRGKNETMLQLFGPERDDASAHAGALAVGDAQLLLLPVRSLVGTFGWLTAPFLLRRLARDASAARLPAPPIVEVEATGRARLGTETVVKHDNKVIFEDLDLQATTEKTVTELAKWLGERLFTGPDAEGWRAMLAKRLCVVHDDAFAFFSQHGTEIVTRIAIDPDVKTVKKGALWTEEHLPSESVLVSLVEAQPLVNAPTRDRKSSWSITPGAALDDLRTLLEHPVQVGGDASTGRGRCRLELSGGER